MKGPSWAEGRGHSAGHALTPAISKLTTPPLLSPHAERLLCFQSGVATAGGSATGMLEPAAWARTPLCRPHAAPFPTAAAATRASSRALHRLSCSCRANRPSHATPCLTAFLLSLSPPGAGPGREHQQSPGRLLHRRLRGGAVGGGPRPQTHPRHSAQQHQAGSGE